MAAIGLQSAITKLYSLYPRTLNADGLKKAIMLLAVRDKATFEQLRGAYFSGQYDTWLPKELKSTSQSKVTLSGLPAVDEFNAIKKSYQDGKITLDQAQNQLITLGQKYPDAVAGFVKYTAKNPSLGYFLAQPFEIAKKGITGGFELVAAAGEKVYDVGAGVVEAVGEGASGILGFFKTNWYIMIGLLVLGGFAVYKVVTSDTGKQLAGSLKR